MSTSLPSLLTLPLNVQVIIFSNLGPHANCAKTCKKLNEVNKIAASLYGMDLANNVEPKLWQIHKLPTIDPKKEDLEQGLKIQKEALALVKKTWPYLNSSQKTRFNGLSLQFISSQPALFREILIINTIISQRKPKEPSSKSLVQKAPVGRPQQQSAASGFFRNKQPQAQPLPLISSQVSWRRHEKDKVPPNSWRSNGARISAAAAPLSKEKTMKRTLHLVRPRKNEGEILTIAPPPPRTDAPMMVYHPGLQQRGPVGISVIAPPPPRTNAPMMAYHPGPQQRGLFGVSVIASPTKKESTPKPVLPPGDESSLKLDRDSKEFPHLQCSQSTTKDDSRITVFEHCGKNLVALSEDFYRFSSLQRIILNANLLSSLPSCIGDLSLLTELSVGSNPLKTLPEEFGKLIHLKRLNLHCTNLSVLPEWIKNLKELTDLDISGNELGALPDWISNLTSLVKLFLSGNKLKKLPDTFGKLVNLSELWVHANQLTTFCSSFGDLTSLTELHASYNLISFLPNSFVNLSHLSKLYLNNNKIEELPVLFGNLTSITILVLSENQLKTVPGSFVNLTALSFLCLNKNKIELLPEECGKLVLLSHLDLSENQLTAPPQTLGRLHSLQKLLLNDNNLLSFPFSLSDFPAITNLNLYCNVGLKPSSELISALTGFRRNSCRMICDCAIEEALASYLQEAQSPPTKKRSPPQIPEDLQSLPSPIEQLKAQDSTSFNKQMIMAKTC